MPTSGRYDADSTESVFDRVWNALAIRGDGRIYHPRDDTNPLYRDPVVDWLIADSTTSDAAFNVSRLRARPATGFGRPGHAGRPDLP